MIRTSPWGTRQGWEGKPGRHSPYGTGLRITRAQLSACRARFKFLSGIVRSRASWMKQKSAHLMPKCRRGVGASKPEGSPQPPTQVAPEVEWKVVLKSVRACNWSGASVQDEMSGWEGMPDIGTSTDMNVHNDSQNFIDRYQLEYSVVEVGTRGAACGSVIWNNAQLWHGKIDVCGSVIIPEAGTCGSRVIDCCQNVARRCMGPTKREVPFSTLLPRGIRTYSIFKGG